MPEIRNAQVGNRTQIRLSPQQHGTETPHPVSSPAGTGAS